MPPHAHGGGDEEEEIIVRTDGPPFADIKAKHVSYYYYYYISTIVIHFHLDL